MIKYNGLELRNLEEQVEKNKQDIAAHYAVDRTLANFGIKIVGTIEDKIYLPDPTTYKGDYGDGFAVGTAGNYDYYIFTRPDYNAGKYENYWLDAGPLGIVGPTGPTPVIANNGEYITTTDPSTQVTTNVVALDDLRGESSIWYSDTNFSYIPNPNKGDMALNPVDGGVYRYNGERWVLQGSIKGPTGNTGRTGPAPVMSISNGYIIATDPTDGRTTQVIALSELKGAKGDTGDVGGFINIAGTLTNINQLPDPASLGDLTVAYLLGTEAPYTLYIQVGSTSDTAIWKDMGPLNVATYITVNGLYQNVWDADTKIDVPSEVPVPFSSVVGYSGNSSTPRIYGLTASAVGAGAKYSVAQYNNNGRLVSADPEADTEVATKNYVDNALPKYQHQLELAPLSPDVDPQLYLFIDNNRSTPYTSWSDLAKGQITKYPCTGRVYDSATNAWLQAFVIEILNDNGITVTAWALTNTNATAMIDITNALVYFLDIVAEN